MNNVILMGRSGSGKTTLTQVLNGKSIRKSKTQSVTRDGFIIDTPGEYVECRRFGAALAVYTYESNIVGLLISAIEPYSLYSPGITSTANRLVVGIVTQIDRENANPDRAERWLKLAGCRKIFRISSVTNEGIDKLKEFFADFNAKEYYKTLKNL